MENVENKKINFKNIGTKILTWILVAIAAPVLVTLGMFNKGYFKETFSTVVDDEIFKRYRKSHAISGSVFMVLCLALIVLGICTQTIGLCICIAAIYILGNIVFYKNCVYEKVSILKGYDKSKEELEEQASQEKLRLKIKSFKYTKLALLLSAIGLPVMIFSFIILTAGNEGLVVLGGILLFLSMYSFLSGIVLLIIAAKRKEEN